MLNAHPRATRRSTLLLLAGLLAAGAAAAQDKPFPSRPITIVIPTAPGGNLDLLARVVAEKLQQSWGQQVVVESRAGANTTLATTYVAKAPADGHTALFTISGFVQNLVLQSNPAYKASDLAPVSLVASFPIAMAANVAVPASTLADVVKLAKEKPGTLSFGSYGLGSGAHVIGAGLNKAAGIDITHVPYKGEAASFPDLASGRIPFAYGSVGFYGRQLSEGKVKLIVVASPSRLKEYPDVPTFAEAGYPDINLAGWGALFLPAGTPPALVDKWSKEVQRITTMPDVQKKIADMGFLPVGNSSAEFARVIESDLQRWGAVVKANNIKLD
ncbi:MAG: tripartite tricarboxylate transporter substrate binding protein [Rubrivivax sp.]